MSDRFDAFKLGKSTTTKKKKMQTNRLTSEMVDWLMNFKRDHKLSAKERGRLKVCRDVAQRDMFELTALAAYLPEDQLRQIFTSMRLKFLIKHLFSARPFSNEEKPNLEQLEKIKEKVPRSALPKDKRVRVLELCDAALDVIGNIHNAQTLAPEFWAPISKATSHESFPFYLIPDLKAIIYQAHVEPHRRRNIEKKEIGEDLAK